MDLVDVGQTGKGIALMTYQPRSSSPYGEVNRDAKAALLAGSREPGQLPS